MCRWSSFNQGGRLRLCNLANLSHSLFFCFLSSHLCFAFSPSSQPHISQPSCLLLFLLHHFSCYFNTLSISISFCLFVYLSFDISLFFYLFLPVCMCLSLASLCASHPLEGTWRPKHIGEGEDHKQHKTPTQLQTTSRGTNFFILSIMSISLCPSVLSLPSPSNFCSRFSNHCAFHVLFS